MRDLTKPEYDLLAFLVESYADKERLMIQLTTFKVVEMNDGGMGSLRFLNGDEQSSFGEEIAEIGLLDIDRIPVFFSINLNKKGNLFELDVFKGDFSRLKKFPVPPYIAL